MIRPHGSLKRFLHAWGLAGGGVLLALASTWLFWQEHGRLAGAQDERLAWALSEVSRAIRESASAGASDVSIRDELPIRLDWPYRVSDARGGLLAGRSDLPPCPWGRQLSPEGTIAYYVGESRGQLTWTAVALRSTGRSDWPEQVVIQVVEPLRERWPHLDELAGGTIGLLWFLAGLAAIWYWLGIEWASAWLRQAGADTDTDDHLPAAGTGPLEIESLVLRTRALVSAQNEWVDEQRRFLANASHQLRTPMTVLRTQLQTAMADPPGALDVLPQMLHTVDRVAGLANQLLSLTKLEMLKRRGELGQVDVRAIARDAVMELSPLIAQKRIDFSLDEAQLSAPADATMLGELIRNLLSNAIHHAPLGGRVGIVLHSHPRAVVVIWDEGPGIDDAIRPRLFHPFAASRGGVGLGLSICLQIAESMGATVKLLNRIEGGGVVGVDAIVAWGQAP